MESDSFPIKYVMGLISQISANMFYLQLAGNILLAVSHLVLAIVMSQGARYMWTLRAKRYYLGLMIYIWLSGLAFLFNVFEMFFSITFEFSGVFNVLAGIYTLALVIFAGRPLGFMKEIYEDRKGVKDRIIEYHKEIEENGSDTTE